MGFVTAAAAGALAWMGAMLAWTAGWHVVPVALTLGAIGLAWRGGIGVPWLLAAGALIGWMAG
jgi:hypothetical protein